MLVGQHLLGIPLLDVSAYHEGVQQAAAHSSVHLGDSRLIKPAGRMKMHARKCWGLDSVVSRHRLKHPIDHAHMEMHMRVQAGAETVNKGHDADAWASRLSSNFHKPTRWLLLPPPSAAITNCVACT